MRRVFALVSFFAVTLVTFAQPLSRAERGAPEVTITNTDRTWTIAGPPRVDLRTLDRSHEVVDQMTALHRRVALLAMTNHEFLAVNYTKERTTFSDGTSVTVDWTAKTVHVSPELK